MTTPADARAAEQTISEKLKAVCLWEREGIRMCACGHVAAPYHPENGCAFWLAVKAADLLAEQAATIARLETEQTELLLDRHQPHRLSPCGHYRVFAMPCVHEDGSETPYCMQCDRDQLQAQLLLAEAAREEATKERDIAKAQWLKVWEALEAGPDGTPECTCGLQTVLTRLKGE